MTGTPVLDDVLLWLLASIRLLALFVSAPPFSHAAVPVRVRLGLGLAVALAISPGPPGLPPGAGLLPLASLVLQEVMVGVSLGFALRLLFSSFELLGEFVSVQGGLGAATVVDPTSGASSPVLANVFHTFALLAFLAIDGHHALLRAAALTFELVPIGGGGLDAEVFAAVVALGSSIFEVAVRMAAPITVAMLVANLAVGMLGRLIPQLNLMMLQLPAHVAITLLLVAIGAGVIVRATAGHLEDFGERSLAAVVGGR